MTTLSEATIQSRSRLDRQMRPGLAGAIARHPLVSFFILANALSWLAWIPYILSNQGLGIWDYDFPVFLGTSQFAGVLPGAYLGPVTSALLVTALTDGREGLRRWAGRLWRWRVNWRWYALAIVGVPVVMVLGGFAVSGGEVHAPSIAALAFLLPGLAIQMLTTGLAEEPGWRDFALPRLQRKMGPMASSFVLGPLWALWHMPLFLTEWGGYPDADWTRIVYFIGFCIAFNVVISWVFNRTNQSLPITMLFHVSVNNTASILLPELYPAISTETAALMLMIVSAIVATAIVITTRGRLGVPVPATIPATVAAPIPAIVRQ